MMALEFLELVTKYAKEYVKGGVSSVHRNFHMNNIKDESLTQDQLEAVIVDFINYMGVKNCIDYAMYTSDLSK
jgi:hypothetical protein